jgi:uroporphyrinogen-III decarboxylase
MSMTSRERVLAALARQEPDRVPYCELGVDRSLAQRLLGWGAAVTQASNLEANAYTVDEAKALAAFLRLDNLTYVLRAPVYANKEAGRDGRLFYGDGLIKTPADLPRLELPDPHDEGLYAGARAFLREKGDYAAWFVTRIGIFPTMLSLGTENFCVALYDDRDFVETVLDRYVDWITVVAERICGMGFDVLASTDDMAFNTAPFFSPAVFRELVLPRYRRVAEKITIPWIIHSDGNILPFADDLIGVGVIGLHPCERGAVDIREVKRIYGDRVCVLGNVDLNLLGMGSPAAVDREVRDLIRDLGPGGGYIVTSGNSLAGYLLPDNVLALSRAVQRYGRYPIVPA